APEDLAEAHGQVLDANLIGIDLADLGTVQAGYPSNPDPANNQLNVGLLNDGIQLDLGSGIQLPLIGNEGAAGLLDLGHLGVASSYASTPNASNAIAAAGAIDGDGAIAVDTAPTDDSAVIDLTQL